METKKLRIYRLKGGDPLFTGLDVTHEYATLWVGTNIKVVSSEVEVKI